MNDGNNPSQSQLNLDIDSQVVRQLGDELITDSEQALLELIKNAFDADASWCSVEIDTKSNNEILEQNTTGVIRVKDNGCGMDMTAIQRGWLTISLSPKRKFKLDRKVTPKYKRTPLGDKGLGRLGSMRLGDILRITTFIDSEKQGQQVSFKWSDCISGRPLTQVPIQHDVVDSQGKQGTTLEVFGLREVAYWEGQDNVSSLSKKLSTMISPFGNIDNFTLALSVNGEKVELLKIGDQFLNLAMSAFEMDWDNQNLTMKGKIRLSLLKTQINSEDFENYIASDNGKAFLFFLQKDKRSKVYSPIASDEQGWFICVSDRKDWGQNIKNTQSLLAHLAKQPGGFEGRLYGFDLSSESGRDLPDFSTSFGDYKKFVKDNAGVFVLRDGFRVRMGDDWLNMGKEWTSGGSYYGLRPGNTIGFIAISSVENSALVEKSDREGFTDNAEWQGFEMVTRNFRDFANDSLESIRRAVIDFFKAVKKEGANPKTSVQEKIKTAGESVRAIEFASKTLRNKQPERRALAIQAASIRREIESNVNIPAELSRQINESLNVVEAVIADTDKVQGVLSDVGGKQTTNDIEVIQTTIEQLKSQVADVYDTVATGLAAQGLMHEINPLLQEINMLLDSIKRTLKKEKLLDFSVLAQLNQIKEINNTVQQRVGFINPMMRTFRESRSNVSICTFLRRYFENRASVFEQKAIKWHIDISPDLDFTIHINQGRLIQILDNIVRNSEYWLTRFGSEKPGVPKEIHVERRNDVLVFWDSGWGVRPAIEDSIFEIFITDKPSGEGHGLGLFLVSQLLANIGCFISLGTERNTFGNRYQFILDFSSIVVEGHNK